MGKVALFIVSPSQAEVFCNPKVAELEVGPLESHLKSIETTHKNILTAGDVDAFRFANQRRALQAFGYALDPSVTTIATPESRIGDRDAAAALEGADVITARGVRPADKRKRDVNNDHPPRAAPECAKLLWFRASACAPCAHLAVTSRDCRTLVDIPRRTASP
eukprot:m.134252 g.134252  ORF g.134252 m.134252 type:complete len:163 (+) comp52441_c0_seq24:1585-2073(+)